MYDLLENTVADFSEIKYIKIRNLTFPVLCPLCGQELSVKDSKRRYIKDELSRKIPFNLKRYFCSSCNKIHTEIPDIIQPYKQYETLTIRKVREGNSLTFAGDNSTIRKWRKEK